MKRTHCLAMLSLLALTSALGTGCNDMIPGDLQDDLTSSDDPTQVSAATPEPTPDSSTITTVAGGGMVGVQPEGSSYSFSGETIVVGTDEGEYGGDLRDADSADLNFPTGVAVDMHGNVYIADILNNRVRRVGADGMITTVAGVGRAGYLGDNGLALTAELYWPGGVAVDAQGYLFIADTRNNRIRMVSPQGLITTVAGNGTAGYSGDGGLAIEASLYYPTGLSVDADGTLYIADYFNNVIRRVSPGGLISTVAGTGQQGFGGDGGPASRAQLNHPGSITVDAEGNLFLTDNFNDRIRRVDTDGNIQTIAGTGARDFSGDEGKATDAALHWPSGIAVDQDGSVFFTDTFNHRLRRIDPEGIIRTIAGTGRQNGYGLGSFGGDHGPASRASLSEPYDVSIDTFGRVYVADAANNRIRMIDWWEE